MSAIALARAADVFKVCMLIYTRTCIFLMYIYIYIHIYIYIYIYMLASMRYVCMYVCHVDLEAWPLLTATCVISMVCVCMFIYIYIYIHIYIYMRIHIKHSLQCVIADC